MSLAETKAGLFAVPKGWVWTSFGQVCSWSKYGLTITSEPGGKYPLLRMNNLQDGRVETSDLAYVNLADDVFAEHKLGTNELLVNRTNSLNLVGKTALFQEPGDFVSASYLVRFGLDEKLVYPPFVNYFFNSPFGQQQLGTLATRGVSQANINPSVLKARFQLPLPPLAEQRKIAAILGAWDEAIAAAERLVAALRERKRGLMQRLLIPDRETEQPATRFSGFTALWRVEELGHVFARVTRKNSVRNTNVLTASGEHGLVSQTTYFKRSVAGEGIENYYLLHRGEFAYNRSSSEGYPYGAIKQLEGYDAGILSTLYLCFQLADESCDANFYRHFFEAGGLNRGIYSIAQEGARNHGLLNVSVSDFFGLRVPVPELTEQQRLAAFFDTAAAEIDVAVQHAEHLREQKRGLMQRLLTGQVQVRVDEGAPRARF